MPDNNVRQTAARAFVRSLNILLKFARMYDFGHPRTVKQYDTAWAELRTALGSDDEAGMLLAVSGDQLLLDGTPLESAGAEKSFARILSVAGIASVHFSPKLTHASLQKFVRAFPTSTGSKPAQLAEQMKEALQGDDHIHVNEVCFVPADSAVAKSTMAAQLAARTLGMNSNQTDQLLNDPEKLLQLIIAAEGTKTAGGGPGGGGPGGGGSGGSGGGGYGRTGYGGGDYAGGVAGSGGGSGWGHSAGYGGAGGPGQSAAGGPPGGEPGTLVAGPVGAVYGTEAPVAQSGWNIVGGSGGGGGTPLDPNAGGFWLKPDVAGSVAPTSGTPSAGLSGPVEGVAAGTNPGAIGSGYGPGYGPGSSAGNGSGEGTQNGGAGGPAPVSGGRQLRGGGTRAVPESRWGNASTGIRATRSARGGDGSMAVETGLMTLHEDELQGILQVLAQIARTNDASKEKLDPGSFQSRLSTLPRRARFTISQALSALAAQAPSELSDKPTLLKLAEHIAVRFALESYERGDLKVNAVRQMLNEMNSELDGLRKILGVYEEKMARAGIHTHSHMEVLAQEFWSQVPEDKKKSVLESADAWCVPAVRVREHVDAMIAGGEKEAAESILKNYARGIKSKNTEARRQTAMGLAELAGLYASTNEQVLMDTIRGIGFDLAEEKGSHRQNLVGARV